MGKVVVTAMIENLERPVRRRTRTIDCTTEFAAVEVNDAMVDTGATTLLLPKRMVAALGLRPQRVRHSRGLGGDFLLPVYGTVRSDDSGS